MKDWKIGYSASWKCDKTLVNPDKPFRTAYIEADTGPEAAESLKKEFPGWDIKVVSVEEYLESQVAEASSF